MGTEITVAQVEGATTGTPLWNKFLEFRMNLWKPAGDQEIILSCPTPDCGKFLVARGVKTAVCPVCKKAFCASCGEDVHDGSTCEEYRRWKDQNTNVDAHFEQLILEQGRKRCPVCRAPSERESGCNFMQCRSEICRKRTYWCFVCGKSMPKEEHYAHYPRGPYEDECNDGKGLAAHPPFLATGADADAGAAVGRALGDGLGALRSW